MSNIGIMNFEARIRQIIEIEKWDGWKNEGPVTYL